MYYSIHVNMQTDFFSEEAGLRQLPNGPEPLRLWWFGSYKTKHAMINNLDSKVAIYHL